MLHNVTVEFLIQILVIVVAKAEMPTILLSPLLLCWMQSGRSFSLSKRIDVFVLIRKMLIDGRR